MKRMMLVVAFGVSVSWFVWAADKPTANDPAVKRTREQTKMLDDLYKNAVVSISKHYVKEQFDTPAAVIAKDVFAAMKKANHHTARLIDATGNPKEAANVAATEFEKKAVKAIKDGKTTFEEIGEADGKPVLRTGTIVPAVMKTCAKCHGVKEGDLLGVLVYELPIK